VISLYTYLMTLVYSWKRSTWGPMRSHMRISRVMVIEREVSSFAEVERPRKASKEEWLSRSRCATPPSFNRIRKPVEETSGSCRALYSRYNVNICVQDARVHYKLTHVRRYAGALPYRERPTNPVNQLAAAVLRDTCRVSVALHAILFAWKPTFI